MNPPASISSITPLIVFTVPMPTTFSPNRLKTSTLNVETLTSYTYALSHPDPYFPIASLSPSCPSQIQYNTVLRSDNINTFLFSMDAFSGPCLFFSFPPILQKMRSFVWVMCLTSWPLMSLPGDAHWHCRLGAVTTFGSSLLPLATTDVSGIMNGGISQPQITHSIPLFLEPYQKLVTPQKVIGFRYLGYPFRRFM